MKNIFNGLYIPIMSLIGIMILKYDVYKSIALIILFLFIIQIEYIPQTKFISFI